MSTQLMISESRENNAITGSSETTLPGINLGNINNIENQLIILKSSSLIEKTINELNLTVSYFQKELFKEIEIYKQSPFIVRVDTSNSKLRNIKFDINFISKSEFLLTTQENKKTSRHKLFEIIHSNNLVFSIHPDTLSTINYLSSPNFSFQINTIDQLINYYKRNILISEIKENATIYEITLIQNNIQKGKDFLNTLAKHSVSYTLDKKNQIANNTINFINNQLIDISDSLAMTKLTLENFRSNNDNMDISMQGQVIIGKIESLENEKNSTERQLEYYQYLNDFIENNQNILNLLPPSNQGIDNNILEQQISELSQLNTEKQSLEFNSKSGNPAIERIQKQIEVQKLSILQLAKSNITTIQKDLDNINNKIKKLSSEIRKLPRKEQKALEIEQTFQSTDRMHTFLLERRSEAQLAKASNAPDNEIIESARLVKQTQPILKKYLLMSVLMGFFLPFTVIYLSIYTNDKIMDQDDLIYLSKTPVIGTIPKLNKHNRIINNNHSSLLSDSVRSIRTLLELEKNSNNSRCLLVTSVIPGEGKSIVAANLAISYAQLGKKTLLIDFDLRRPTQQSLLNIKAKTFGLSAFLAMHKQEYTTQLIYTCDELMIDVIPSGKIPPNPTELIAANHTALLFNEIKRLYDVIIIDSPPIGLFSDAILLSSYSDTNILIARHNRTPKPMLANVLTNPKITNPNNSYLILNDLPMNKKKYNDYTNIGKHKN